MDVVTTTSGRAGRRDPRPEVFLKGDAMAAHSPLVFSVPGEKGTFGRFAISNAENGYDTVVELETISEDDYRARDENAWVRHIGSISDFEGDSAISSPEEIYVASDSSFIRAMENEGFLEPLGEVHWLPRTEMGGDGYGREPKMFEKVRITEKLYDAADKSGLDEASVNYFENHFQKENAFARARAALSALREKAPSFSRGSEEKVFTSPEL